MQAGTPQTEIPGREKPRLTIRSLLRPHLAALSLGLLAVIGEGLANLLEPWPLKVVLDDVLGSHPAKGFLDRLVHAGVGYDRLAIVTLACAAVLLIAALNALCSYVEKYLTTSVGQWVTHDLRQAIYAHVQRLSLAYHDEKRSGDLISRVTSDVDAIQSFISSGLLGTLVNGLTLAGMVGVMFYLNWRFTLIALSVAPLLFGVVYTYTRRIKKATRAVRRKEGEIVSVMEEVLSAIRVVKAFAREDYELQRFEEQNLESMEIALNARSLKAKLAPLVQIIVAAGTCLVLWFGARMALSGVLSAGDMVVFILYLGKMYKPMQELSKMTDAYSKAAVGYERVQEVLATEREVKDLPGARRAPKLKGRIAFDRVWFEYVPDHPVLREVSFEVEPGQLTALVGPTGAGKTTIISLLPRFYDPSAGAVRIDGRDVRGFTQRSLRRQMSLVLQDSVLFHAPIWHNIAYGKPDARPTEVLRAAELANAREFIEELPEGYATMVGERGMTLSGGQKQRIAIARAIIRNAPILLLDEPTSSLDAASERLVFEALDRLMEGRTAIVIAHRLSTAQRADAILVVEEGRIVERGTHQALSRSGGLYAQLRALQLEAGAQPIERGSP